MPEGLRDSLSSSAVAIWTTTGWTIPANEAVAVNERMKYVLVEAQARAQLAIGPDQRFLFYNDLGDVISFVEDRMLLR